MVESSEIHPGQPCAALGQGCMCSLSCFGQNPLHLSTTREALHAWLATKMKLAIPQRIE